MKAVQTFSHLFNHVLNLFCFSTCLLIFLPHVHLDGIPLPAAAENQVPQPATLSLPELTPIATPTPQAQETTSAPETAAISSDKIGVQGNWVKKKDWLLRSNDVFEEIQNNVLEIQATKKNFNEKFHTLDGEIDDFYKDLCIDQGKLQELFDSVERYLEKKKKKDLAAIATGEQDQNQDRDYLAKLDLLTSKLKKDKEELEQLKLDIKSIEDLDQAASERLKKVDEQITQTQEEFTKIQTSMSDLWDIIDDKKARVIYYELKGNSSEKIKNILSYLKDDLLKDFDSIIEKTRLQIAKIKDSIKKLEEKGYIIKNRSKRIEKIKLQELQDQEEAKKKADKIPVKEELFDPNKNKRPLLFHEKIYDYITTAISKIYHFFTSLFGSTPPKKNPPLQKIDTSLTTTYTTTTRSATSAPPQPQAQLPLIS